MTENRSMKTVSILLIITNIAVVLCLCLTACLMLAGLGTIIYLINYPSGLSSTDSTTVNVSQSAPDFQLDDLYGKTFSLKQFSGHPVLLNFWATWCGPCKEEMPLIVESYRIYQPDLVVLAVNEGETILDVTTFLADNPLPFMILLDESQEVGDLYGVYAYPTTFFVDASGIVQAVEVGSMDSNTIDEDLLLVGVP
jgi:thiol-disulfide isomerase/thioredoxin